MRKLNIILATVFGAGYFPKAPGTIGTLVAAIIYFYLPAQIFDYTISILPVYLFLIMVCLSLISVYICSDAEKTLGHDDGKIVIDEFFGYFFAVFFLPKTILVIFLAFIIFRFFDIVKPPPIFQIQKMKAGWGIMADDILAGIFANVVIRIILLLL